MSVCADVHTSCARMRPCVSFQGEDQNKSNIFKQLASVQLCGIASHVVCLVNQLKWVQLCVAAVHFPYVHFFFLSRQVET